MLRRMSEFEEVERFETVRLLRHEGAAIVEMDRPEVRNAWNSAMASGLVAALRACQGDDVRAVLVRGAGAGFSAGADLGSFGEEGLPMLPSGRVDLERVLHDRYHPIMRLVRGLDKPVLAAVDGAAAGIGMSFALACDLVTASERASFNHAFTKIGLGPDGGASLFLLARVGWARTSEIMLEGRRVGAEEALRIGLINRVLPVDGFHEAAEAQLVELAGGPTAAFSAGKRAINAQVLTQFEQVLALEAREQSRMSETDDFVAAAMAFLRKEEPRYAGR